MNSANKLLLALIIGSVSAVSVPAHAQPAPAVEPAKQAVPAPSKAPLAESESMEDFVGEGAEAKSADAEAEDVFQLLQSGNSGKPLTISQLAKINDAIKRMEFLSELEKKASENGGVGGRGATAAPSSNLAAPDSGMTPVMGQSALSSYSVLQIFGLKGQYEAVVYDGKTQVRVKEGDTLSNGRVSRISLNGVIVSTGLGGETQLPFNAPGAMEGVRVSTR